MFIGINSNSSNMVNTASLVNTPPFEQPTLKQPLHTNSIHDCHHPSTQDSHQSFAIPITVKCMLERVHTYLNVHKLVPVHTACAWWQQNATSVTAHQQDNRDQQPTTITTKVESTHTVAHTVLTIAVQLFEFVCFDMCLHHINMTTKTNNQ